MKFPRRLFLKLAVASAIGPTFSKAAIAPDYPTRPIKLVVPFPAGGVSDILARLIGQSLSERLDQPIVIENRPGAGTNIGTAVVAHAPADGYTILLLGTTNSINATLYEKLNFDFLRDIEPVASIARFVYFMEVAPSLPVHIVQDFIAFAKAHPGNISVGSNGIGAPSHLAGELFKQMTGIDMVHVPYPGTAQALQGLMAGQVQVMFDSTGSSIEHVRAGNIRALAVTSSKRLETLPDLPTVAESLPGFEISAMNGVGAPRGTPAFIVERLNREIASVLGDGKIQEQLFALGLLPFSSSSTELGIYVAGEVEKWGKLIKAANIKPI